MIKRKIFSQIKQHLTQKEITLLIGPRQAGKTTLLKQCQDELQAQGHKTLFLNLDIDTDAQFFTSQESLVQYIQLHLGKKPGVVFIDEFQRKTNAGLFLKGIYDRGLPYKYVVSGSGSVELKEHLHESLTGRKRIFTLPTVGFAEFVDYATDYQFSKHLADYLEQDSLHQQSLLAEYLTYGGYPRVVTEPRAEEKRLVLQELYQSYLAKDIALLLGIKKTAAFTNLVRLLADRIGRMIPYIKMSSLLSLSFPTLQNYLWSLEQTFVLEKISPYATNLAKELKKAPLFYFCDLGFRNTLLDAFHPFRSSSERGFLFQNFVFRLLADQIDPAISRLHYWRTKQGGEVDFVLESSNEVIPLEVKYRNLEKNTIPYGLSDFLREYQPKRAYVVNLNRRGLVREGKTDVHFLPYYDLLRTGII